MKIPEGFTEQEVLDTIESVARRLAPKFKFGYHDIDDIKQEAFICAAEKLDNDKYDAKLPLENFLYVCIHNHLFNHKRNKFARPDKPCFTCPLYDKNCERSTSQCLEFENKLDCTLYRNWSVRNDAKKNIMRPTDITNVADENEKNMRVPDQIENVELEELWSLIDSKLDIKLRADYIRLRSNIKIPKQRRLLVEAAVLEITREFYGGT
jgi:DNA-directed RNA polymerase specialized sigma24 family protein